MIDPHDLGIKLKKVMEFLAEGHQVRVEIYPKKGDVLKNPRAVDETTLKILDTLEPLGVSISKLTSKHLQKSEFIIYPAKASSAKKEEDVSSSPLQTLRK